MKNKDKRSEDAAGLRQQAEEIFLEKDDPSSENLEALSPQETRQMLHELQVHQIELELQNEELRRSEAELDAARTRYFDLYDLAPVGYCTVSEKGLILEANLTAATLLGVARGKLSRQLLSGFIIKEHKDVYYLHHKALLETKSPQTCELQMVKNDGSQFWVRLESTASHNATGAPLCRFVLSDITERKRQEELIHDSYRRLESIIEGTHVGTWEWNVQTGEAVFNEVWAQIIGYTLDELAPVSIKTWETFTHPDDLRQSTELLERHFAGELPYYDCECRMKHKDGHWVWVHDRGRVITCTGDNKPLMMFGTHTDITERKRDEDKINSLLTEKELLLREVHHRIKNHMNVIMSLLSLQKSTLKDPLAVSSLEDARSRVQSMMILYDKLYRTADFRTISTKEYLTSLIYEIVGNFPNRGKVAIETQIDDFSVGAKTLSPVGMILNEVLTNTMKHAFIGRDNGVIGVSLSIKETKVTLVIEDNGIGIPESIDVETSTGFGLQVVGILTKQLQGAVRIERKKGSAFILEFEV